MSSWERSVVTFMPVLSFKLKYQLRRSSILSEYQQHLCYPGQLLIRMGWCKLLIVLVLLGKYAKVYKCILLAYKYVFQLYSLGEACSHIAALLSCVVKASQARQSAGVDSSTSVACSWLPPSRNVSI